MFIVFIKNGINTFIIIMGDVKKYKIYLKTPKTKDIEEDNSEIAIESDIKKDKKTVRNWSSNFWSENNISDILKEVIEPEAVDVSSIKMNDNLSDIIWDGDDLKPEIRKLLLMNAKRFIEFCDIDDLKFYDIILTGSMANYNYNENSDIDIHIIIDFDQISKDDEFISSFFKLKKQLWEEKIQSNIYGHDIELYIQNEHEKHHSSGTYSLIKNDWLIKPTKKIINIDMASVQFKSANFMNRIDNIIEIDDYEIFQGKYDELKEKIRKLRRDGLSGAGEYSVENLVFKILRNSNYLGNLIEKKHKLLSKELSN